MTPRTSGSFDHFSAHVGASCTASSISPSGVRTATAQVRGPRIITPSMTAWPPMKRGSGMRQVRFAAPVPCRRPTSRTGAGSARRGRRCRPASACPCRRGGTRSRAPRAAIDTVERVVNSLPHEQWTVAVLVVGVDVGLHDAPISGTRIWTRLRGRREPRVAVMDSRAGEARCRATGPSRPRRGTRRCSWWS